MGAARVDKDCEVQRRVLDSQEIRRCAVSTLLARELSRALGRTRYRHPGPGWCAPPPRRPSRRLAGRAANAQRAPREKTLSSRPTTRARLGQSDAQPKRPLRFAVRCGILWATTSKHTARRPGRYWTRVAPARLFKSSTSAPPSSPRSFPLPKSLPHNYCATTHRPRFPLLSHIIKLAHTRNRSATRRCGSPELARLAA
jgi:hypothetical protein